MKRVLFALLFLVGCTSPQEVLIMPAMGGMRDGMLGGGNMMPRIEYQCPLCVKQYKTEYLAQKCIDSHE